MCPFIFHLILTFQSLDDEVVGTLEVHGASTVDRDILCCQTQDSACYLIGRGLKLLHGRFGFRLYFYFSAFRCDDRGSHGIGHFQQFPLLFQCLFRCLCQYLFQCLFLCLFLYLV